MSWKQLRKQSLGKKSQEWEEYPWFIVADLSSSNELK